MYLSRSLFDQDTIKNIQKITPSASNLNDESIQIHSRDGKLTTKSFYYTNQNDRFNKGNESFQNMLWKQKIHETIKHYMWHIAMNSLPQFTIEDALCPYVKLSPMTMHISQNITFSLKWHGGSHCGRFKTICLMNTVTLIGIFIDFMCNPPNFKLGLEKKNIFFVFGVVLLYKLWQCRLDAFFLEKKSLICTNS